MNLSNTLKQSQGTRVTHFKGSAFELQLVRRGSSPKALKRSHKDEPYR